MSAPNPHEEINLQRHMARGSIWTIALRWSIRLTGLISTVILARLLSPVDYGIVSIATMILGLVQVFGQIGVNSAIIRHPNPTPEHYNSAWTLSLLIGLSLGLFVFSLAPLMTAYFHEPRATLVVEILALRLVLSGAQNIGVVNFRRNLQFDKQFWFNVAPSLVSFTITIGAAMALRNYWALVIGLMIGQITSFLASYAMEPHRPRICFARVNEIGSFSVWMLIENIGGYLNTLVDRIAIGGFAGSAAMGRYYVATDVATSPSQELVGPIVAVLFPVMATVQHDKAKLRNLYLTVLYWMALICTSTGIGVALIADDMVDLVLGPQWEGVKPLIPWFALSYGVLGLSSSVYISFETIGRSFYSARLQWTRLVGLSLTVFPIAYHFRDLEIVAAARLVVTIMLSPALFYAMLKPFDLKASDFLATLWRPWFAGFVMAIVVLRTNAAISFTGNLRLLLDIAVGSVTYAGSLMVLWLLIGRPAGPENILWNLVITSLRPARRFL